MTTAATSNRAYLWFLEFIKINRNWKLFNGWDQKIGKNVNYYISVYSDNNIKGRYYVMV
jgi:hypothetical protein